MSTRAVIKFIEIQDYGKPQTVAAQIYQHHDGYPHVEGQPEVGLVHAIVQGLLAVSEDRDSRYLKIGQIASFVAKALIESGRTPQIERPTEGGDHQWDYEIRSSEEGFELRYAKRASGSQHRIGSEEYEGREWISHCVSRKQAA